MNISEDLIALDDATSVEILGGEGWSWGDLAKIAVTIIATEIVKNWPDFVAGFKQGEQAAHI